MPSHRRPPPRRPPAAPPDDVADAPRGPSHCPLFPDVPLDDGGFIEVFRAVTDESGRLARGAHVKGKWPPSLDQNAMHDHPRLGPGAYFLQLRRANGQVAGAVQVLLDGEPHDPDGEDDADGDDPDEVGGPIEMVTVAPGHAIPVPTDLPAAAKVAVIQDAQRKLEEKAARGQMDDVMKLLLTRAVGGAEAATTAGEAERLRREVEDLRRELDTRRTEWQSEKRRLEEERSDVRRRGESEKDDQKREYERRLERLDEERKTAVADLRRALEDARRDFDRRTDDARRDADRRADEDRRRHEAELAAQARTYADLERYAREELRKRDEQIAALQRQNLGTQENLLKEKYRQGEASTLEALAPVAIQALAPMIDRMTGGGVPPPHVIAAIQAQAQAQAQAAAQAAAQEQHPPAPSPPPSVPPPPPMPAAPVVESALPPGAAAEAAAWSPPPEPAANGAATIPPPAPDEPPVAPAA